MIRAQYFDPTTGKIDVGGTELLERWQGSLDGIIWVDFDGVPENEERVLLKHAFALHRHSIVDVQTPRRPPKVEVFEDHTFLLLKGLDAHTNCIDFDTIQIGIFVSERFLVTRHGEKSLSIDRLWEKTQAGEASLAGGCDTLALILADLVTERYVAILLAVEDQLDMLEREVADNPEDYLLAQLISLKSDLTRMRRIMTYHTQIFQELRSAPPPGIRAELRHDLRVVYEKLERVTSLASLYYDLSSDLMDGYISMASHRLNNIMKFRTVVSTIFIPLTFIAGVYGMNFEYMPELRFHFAYFILLFIMGVIATALVILFKRKKWL